MKNGDMPAMPTPTDMAYFAEKQVGILGSGLTKREMFAIHIMSGMAAVGYNWGDYKDMATCAVKQADSLLLILEKTK